MRRAEAVDFMTADDRSADAHAETGEQAIRRGNTGWGSDYEPEMTHKCKPWHRGCDLSLRDDQFSPPHTVAASTPNRVPTITGAQGAAAMCPDGLGNRAGFGE